MSEQQGQPFVPQQPGVPPVQPSVPGQPGVPPVQPAVPAQPVTPPAQGSKGVNGLFSDAATLVATGLLLASAFAILAGGINFLGDPGKYGGLRERIVALTITVDVGDIALLGVAVAMLVLTPDPPGGIPRKVLLWISAALSAIITLLGVIRGLEVITEDGSGIYRFAGFVATAGLVVAAATIAFFSAKEASVRDMSDSS